MKKRVEGRSRRAAVASRVVAVVARTSTERKRLVIVGAGMSAHRLCERLVELDAIARYDVTLVGDEGVLPYDRLRLGARVSGRVTIEALAMRDRDWYSQQGISLMLADAVCAIDRERKVVRHSSGHVTPYDVLVIATGSSANRPSFLSRVASRIQTYRDERDAETLRALVAQHRGASALVIGAGLLGIELSVALRELGCSVRMFEVASHLLPRFLDLEGSERLRRALLVDGIVTEKRARVKSLHEEPDRVVVTREGGEVVEFDFVVVAIGISSRDALARDAGLTCAPNGGVYVNEYMQTDDASIFAIGECASFNDTRIGLISPCYDTVETVARNLCGEPREFRHTSSVVKLKYDKFPITVVGEPRVDDPGFDSLTQADLETYRCLVIRRGRLVAASIVGPWEESATAVAAAARADRFGGTHRRRFRDGDLVWDFAANSVHNWADDVPLCTCTGATCGVVRTAVREGCNTLPLVAQRTGASSVCGSCIPSITQLLDPEAIAAPRSTQWSMVVAGVIAMIAVVAFVAAPPLSWPTSVRQSFEFEQLLRDKLTRQLSGFTLAGVCAVSLLLSVRKRVPRVRWGAYGRWRIFHTTLGTMTLLVAAIHTKFRVGSNLNGWLMASFLVLASLGALAAVSSAFERRWNSHLGGIVRRKTLLVHQVLFWPFPILVVLHALKTFYF